MFFWLLSGGGVELTLDLDLKWSHENQKSKPVKLSSYFCATSVLRLWGDGFFKLDVASNEFEAFAVVAGDRCELTESPDADGGEELGILLLILAFPGYC